MLRLSVLRSSFDFEYGVHGVGLVKDIESGGAVIRNSSCLVGGQDPMSQGQSRQTVSGASCATPSPSTTGHAALLRAERSAALDGSGLPKRGRFTIPRIHLHTLVQPGLLHLCSPGSGCNVAHRPHKPDCMSLPHVAVRRMRPRGDGSRMGTNLVFRPSLDMKIKW